MDYSDVSPAACSVPFFPCPRLTGSLVSIAADALSAGKADRLVAFGRLTWAAADLAAQPADMAQTVCSAAAPATDCKAVAVYQNADNRAVAAAGAVDTARSVRHTVFGGLFPVPLPCLASAQHHARCSEWPVLPRTAPRFGHAAAGLPDRETGPQTGCYTCRFAAAVSVAFVAYRQAARVAD